MLLGFGFIPCAPPSSAGWSGDFGEGCLSAQREFRSRLTSRATQGTREAGGKLGSPSFWLLFLGEARKSD
jgi:hypothetical protein